MGGTSRAATANRSIKVHHLLFSKVPQSSFLYPFVLFSFRHCIVCPSSIYGFEYLFGIFKIFVELMLFSKQLSYSS